MEKSSFRVDEKLRHIAFIMDGNGRWARQRGMPREYGHGVGARVFRRVIRYCGDIGITAVTVYSFSTENWKRPPKEVRTIMKLFQSYLKDAEKEAAEYDIRLCFLGDKGVFPENMRLKMERLEEDTKYNRLTLNVAINYGGRDDIVHAVNCLIAEGRTHVTEEDITSHLYTSHCPPPDLIVRTGAEMRLSNFLLWQAAYSELYFTDVLWPDFTEDEVLAAVENFYARKRRFGGV